MVDYRSTRIAAMFAALYSCLVSVLILHAVLLRPGPIESIDIAINYNSNQFRSIFPSWNLYASGSNAPFLSQTLVYFWYFLSPDPATVQRMMYLFVFWLMGFVSFLVFFLSYLSTAISTRSMYLSSIATSIVFVFNPWVVVQTFHWFYLWSYALTPALFYFVKKAMDEKQIGKLFAHSATAGAVLAITQVHAFVIAALFVSYLILALVVLRNNSLSATATLRNAGLVMLGVATSTLLVSAFWMIPFALHFGARFSGGAQWATNPNDVINVFSRSADIFNSIRLAGNTSWGSIFPVQGWMFPLWLFSSFFIVLVSFSAIIFRPRDRGIQQLCVLAILSIFLSKGTNEPEGSFYLWMVFKSPISNSLGWLFKDPYGFGMILGFCYAFLTGSVALLTGSEKTHATIVSRVRFTRPYCQRAEGHAGQSIRRRWTSLFPNTKNRPLGMTTLFLAILLASGLQAYPLLSGSLGGWLTPVSIPSYYLASNEWLVSQTNEGPFRVMWIPQSSSVYWSPHPGYQGIPKLDQWASSVPVLLYGWGGALSLPLRVYGNFLYDLLSENRTDRLGVLAAPVSLRYVLFHNDTTDSADYSQIYSTLSTQVNLEKAFLSHNITVFRNLDASPHVSAYGMATLVVGGLGSLLDLSAVSNINSQGIVFSDLEADNLISLLDSPIHKVIVFLNGHDINDLAIASLGQRYLISPAKNTPETYPLSLWKTASFYDGAWTSSTVASLGQGLRFDFDLNQGFLYTNAPNAETNFKISVESSGPYRVFARVMSGPVGGSLSISLRQDAKTILTVAPILRGFEWHDLGELAFQGGTIDVAIRNLEGVNVINALAVIPTSTFDERMAFLREETLLSEIPLSYIWGAAYTDTPDSFSYLGNFDAWHNWETVVVRKLTGTSAQIGDSLVLMNNITYSVGDPTVVQGHPAVYAIYNLLGQIDLEQYPVWSIRMSSSTSVANNIIILSGLATDGAATREFHLWLTGKRAYTQLTSAGRFEETDVRFDLLQLIQNQLGARFNNIRGYLSLALDNDVPISNQPRFAQNVNRVEFQRLGPITPVIRYDASFGRSGVNPLILRLGSTLLKGEVSVSFNVLHPAPYVLALRVPVGPSYGMLNITIANANYVIELNSLSEGIEWRHVGPVRLQPGGNSIRLANVNGISDIDEIFMYPAPQINQGDSIYDQLRPAYIPLVRSFQRDGDNFQVSVDSPGPFILQVKESYDKLWSTDKNSLHLNLFGATNGFLISTSPERTIIIGYAGSEGTGLGLTITSVSIASIILGEVAASSPRRRFRKDRR